MRHVEELMKRYPALECCRKDIIAAIDILTDCYRRDGMVFVAGNGGSCADSAHIVGELLKGFLLKRRIPADDCAILNETDDGSYVAPRLQCGLRAMSLMEQGGLTTAVQNDNGYDMGPAQQLYAMGRPNDVFIGISTSGNARNISLACQVARLRGIPVIGLTGAGGGKLLTNSTVCIRVPETETYKVQELHLPVYHVLCSEIEEIFFG